MDVALLRALNGLRSSHLDAIVRIINSWGFYAIPIGAVICALIQRTRARAIAARDVVLAWFAGLLFAEDVLKSVIHRPRPGSVPALRTVIHVLGRNPGSYSFPSGTAVAVFAASTAVWLGFGHRAGILATVVATVVSVTRIYVGVHYPTDILAGALVGAGVGYVAFALTRWIERRSA